MAPLFGFCRCKEFDSSRILGAYCTRVRNSLSVVTQGTTYLPSFELIRACWSTLDHESFRLMSSPRRNPRTIVGSELQLLHLVK
jgi:hypothetical protein